MKVTTAVLGSGVSTDSMERYPVVSVMPVPVATWVQV